MDNQQDLFKNVSLSAIAYAKEILEPLKSKEATTKINALFTNLRHGPGVDLTKPENLKAFLKGCITKEIFDKIKLDNGLEESDEAYYERIAQEQYNVTRLTNKIRLGLDEAGDVHFYVIFGPKDDKKECEVSTEDTLTLVRCVFEQFIVDADDQEKMPLEYVLAQSVVDKIVEEDKADIKIKEKMLKGKKKKEKGNGAKPKNKSEPEEIRYAVKLEEEEEEKKIPGGESEIEEETKETVKPKNKPQQEEILYAVKLEEGEEMPGGNPVAEEIKVQPKKAKFPLSFEVPSLIKYALIIIALIVFETREKAQVSPGQPNLELLLKEKAEKVAGHKGINLSSPYALHDASEKGLLDIIEYLIQRGIDVDSKDQQGLTPLHITAGYGETRISSFLLEKGASIQSKDKENNTPLHLAASLGHTDTCSLLLDKGADITARDKDGNTPLHFAAGFGHTETSKLLLQRGANINARTDEGNTPLYFAARLGQTETCRLLMNKGASVHARNFYGITALQVAESKGHVGVRKLLQEYIDTN